MTYRPLKNIELPRPADDASRTWVGEIGERLSDPDCDRYALCRDALAQLYFPGLANPAEASQDETLPAASRLSLLCLDPHNITLEPEFYADIDADQYAKTKPLLWLWQSFDRSPAGGGNVLAGVELRRTLARHIFRSCGKNFKCFQYVEFSYGYNMEVGDDVVVHRHVLLDDRGGIRLGNRVSIADYANVYSHTHDVVEQADVTNAATVLEDGVRVTYHATVLAGTTLGTNSMLGAMGVASRDLEAHWVHLGIPAKKVKKKPNAPPEQTKA